MPTIYGTDGDDFIEGTAGDDGIVGFQGNDQINGNGGDDTIYGGLGNDQLSGGIGNDNLQGQDGDDVLNGDDGDDQLYGGLGSDIVNGGAGNDLIYFRNDYQFGSDWSAGDQVNGGDGLDTIIFNGDIQAGDSFDIRTMSLTGIEQIRADLGVILSFSQLSQFFQISGILSVSGSGALDLTGNRFTSGWLRLGSGNDVVTMAGNSAGEQRHLSGGGGNDQLIGSELGDTLSGDDGDDRLEGRSGDDYLDGGNGNDLIEGGAGADNLTGGSGADLFVIRAGDGSDSIVDFAQGVDKIDIRAYGFATFGEFLARASEQFGSVVINLASGQTLTLSDTTLASLAAADFVGMSTAGSPSLDSIIPALPAQPTVTPITQPITVVSDGYVPYTVGAGTTVYSTSVPALFRSYGSGYISPLTNNGTIWSDLADNADSTLAMFGAYNHVRGVENNGLMVLYLGRATTVNAFGFQETDVNNNGQIYIINEGSANAWLINTFLSAQLVTNNGLVAVQAQHGLAFGYVFQNAANFDNRAGAQLLVEGQGATALHIERGSPFPIEINNSGTIIAHSLDTEQLSFGLSLNGDFQTRFVVTNSGLLRADVAIFGGDDAATESADVIQEVENLAGGQIDGLIYLQRGNDMLTNAGTINGDVYMGDDADIVDTSAGVINGLVDLGDGTDQYVGSAYADEVYGGAGNDTLAGNGGNDFLEGGDGNDTINGGSGFDIASYSEATAGVVVDLSIAGAQNTVGAGFDTLSGIEDLVGSDFADQLAGDGAGNFLYGLGGNDILTGRAGSDTLTGGAGLDSFTDSRAGLSGDTITDLSLGDRIVLTDATLAGFTFSLSGSTLTYTGGSLTLTGGVSGQLVASAAVEGGVQLTLQAAVPTNDVRNDFNGDGRSDILWRNVDGQLSNWLGLANGGFTPNNANAAAVVPTAWAVAGTGDFNGDGRDDILWRHTDGTLSNWLATAAGGYVANDANAAVVVPTDWHVVGTGDFNGDGRDDILWRHNDGTISNWLGTAAGGFVANDANAAAPVPTAWHVAGVGDFNGDGRDDILWRNDDGQLSNWLGTATGGFTPNNANAAAVVPTAWSVIGTGDFNGDGRDDILWRHTDGTLSNWLGTATGGYIANDANAAVAVPLAWSVVATGDYNGDGRDDILWRHTDGTLSNWLGTAAGGFTPNDANAATPVPTSWQVQPDDLWI